MNKKLKCRRCGKFMKYIRTMSHPVCNSYKNIYKCTSCGMELEQILCNEVRE